MIKAWVNEFHHIVGRQLPDYSDPDLAQGAFNSALDRLARLEEIGFEGVFFAEHHFKDTLNPNPNLMLAALSQRTKRLRLGVMGNVLAFHQPWRLAEDLAMLDYLTNGRLEIGFATGIAGEFDMIGLPADEIRPRYAEIMDFLDAAGKSLAVTHHGKYYDYDELYLMPRPKPVARRRKWMAIYTPSSAAIAAERNYKVCTAYQTVEAAAEAFEAYIESCHRSGRDVCPDDIGLRRTVIIWDRDEDAADLSKELVDAAVKRLAGLHFSDRNKLDPGAKISGIRDVETNRSASSPGAAPRHDRFQADEFIHGSPATVAEKIIDQCRRTGAGNLLAIHSDAHTEEELSHLYELWRQVLPVLAKAEIALPSLSHSRVPESYSGAAKG